MKIENAAPKKSIFEKLIAVYLFVFTAVLSGSAIQSLGSSNLQMYLIFLTGACCAVPFFIKIKDRIQISEGFVLIWIFMLLINAIAFPQDLLGNISRIFFILIAYYIANKYNSRSIFKALIIFSVVVAVVAIIGTWLLNETSLLRNLPTATNVNDVEYKFGLIYNYIPIAEERVCGYFWEPGLLATCMVYAAFIYGCMYVDKLNVKSIIILAVLLLCCFMTTSSAGYILGCLCIFAFFMRNAKNKPTSAIAKMIKNMLFIVFVLVLINLDSIIISTGLADNEYVAKLLLGNVKESTRSLAISTNLEGFIHSPIVGLGVTSAHEIGVDVTGDTSTTTFAMLAYGLGGISYTLAIIYGSFKQKRLSVHLRIILCTILLMIVNKEPHLGNMFTWIIIFTLLKEESAFEDKSIKQGIRQ